MKVRLILLAAVAIAGCSPSPGADRLEGVMKACEKVCDTNESATIYIVDGACIAKCRNLYETTCREVPQ